MIESYLNWKPFKEGKVSLETLAKDLDLSMSETWLFLLNTVFNLLFRTINKGDICPYYSKYLFSRR
jgi:hypothetical protein